MASTDLDLPLLPSAEQIRRREFATIRRGYDPDQVRDYLSQIAAQVETLEGELREARAQGDPDSDAVLSVPEPIEDPYEKLAVRLANVIRTADEEAEGIVDEARAEAGRTMQESRAEADRIRVDAQARAEDARQEGQESLQNARIEAERLLSGLSARRETLVAQLQDMQTKLMGVARDIETAIDDPEAQHPEPSASATDHSESAGEGDPVDPRYEDLWTSAETSELHLTDLGPIDLDFGDEDDDDDDD